ncbi:hypothetical protein [Enterococcus faecalis]|uniref:hypothetical protein n=1 Tax=Enterococcus faecalis TaxID=1351 RepID=UPI00376FB791
MIFVLKLFGAIVIILGLTKLYDGVKNKQNDNKIPKKFVFGIVLVIIGIAIFPSWSNSSIDAEKWAHSEFREVYWNSVNTIKDTDSQIDKIVLYLESDSQQLTKNAFDNLGIEYEDKSPEEIKEVLNRAERKIKDANKMINDYKVPWYLSNNIYKDGNKIMALQSKQLDLLQEKAQGYKKKGGKFSEKAWDIRTKLDKLEEETNDILEENNLLYY